MNIRPRTIHEQYLRTPTEELLGVGTLRIEPKNEQEWHMPQGLLMGRYTVDEIRGARQKKKHRLIGAGILWQLGLPDEKLVMPFEELDSTGQTVKDPIIAGLWDEGKGEVIAVEGRDLTREIYKLFAEYGIDLHLRSSRQAEGGTSATLEKE